MTAAIAIPYALLTVAAIAAAVFAALWLHARRAVARAEADRASVADELALCREAFDQMPLSFFLVTPDHRIAILNKATEALSGLSREQIIRDGCFGLFCDRRTHYEKCPGHASLFTGKDWNGAADFNGRHYEVAVRPVRHGGQIPYSLVSLTDTTALVAQRKTLEKVVPRLESLLRNSASIRSCIADFATVHDPAAVVARAMRTAFELFHATYAFLTRLEPDGSCVRVHAEFRSPDYDTGYLTPVERGRIVKHFAGINELVYRSGDEKDPDKFVDFMLQRSRSTCAFFSVIRHDGKIWGHLGILSDDDSAFTPENEILRRDIVYLIEIGLRRFRLIHALEREKRELVIAKEAAESASRAKSTFLATISHEIRTPLNAVIGFSELLAGRDVAPKDVREYTGGIIRASNALLALINDILDFSKLEAGVVDMHGDCNMASLFDDMVAIFTWRSREKGIALVPSLSPDIPARINFPEKHMRHILLNLIGNAVKFTDKGTVSWSASLVREQDGTDSLELIVRDTGIGIDPALHEAIFDPFVQDISTRGGKVYAGTGLGLPIVRRLLNACSGSIRVESTPGHGSVFFVRIPKISAVTPQVAPTAVTPVATPATLAFEGERRPPRILLVDDISVNLRVLSLHLRAFGIRDCVCAVSGNAALEALRNHPVDVVLTDVWMPDGNGADLARAMRADPVLARIPVYAVTADNDVSASFDTSLFNGILTKPVSHDSLATLLSSISPCLASS